MDMVIGELWCGSAPGRERCAGRSVHRSDARPHRDLESLHQHEAAWVLVEELEDAEGAQDVHPAGVMVVVAMGGGK
jgi:hypothetical protein